jgi:two-component system chemotaxis sensor kinase CheA
VLVFADKEHNMGLVVDEIVDIIEEQVQVSLTADKPGLLGSAIIGGKATDLIDAGHYLTQAFEDWFGVKADGAFGGVKLRRVLLVDDSPFFRNLLTPLLSVAGYAVTTVDSADRALSLAEAGEAFDVIISDIEMPGMNGFEFAETVRALPNWQATPLVALSSHATPQDLDRGRIAGFSDYVAKFDRDALLETLSQTLSLKGAA